jgi:hypothetical protein
MALTSGPVQSLDHSPAGESASDHVLMYGVRTMSGVAGGLPVHEGSTGGNPPVPDDPLELDDAELEVDAAVLSPPPPPPTLEPPEPEGAPPALALLSVPELDALELDALKLDPAPDEALLSWGPEGNSEAAQAARVAPANKRNTNRVRARQNFIGHLVGEADRVSRDRFRANHGRFRSVCRRGRGRRHAPADCVYVFRATPR